MRKQLTTDTAATFPCSYIGMSNQRHVLHVLNAHNALKRTLNLEAPKNDSSLNLTTKLVACHIGFMPAICRDHTSMSLLK